MEGISEKAHNNKVHGKKRKKEEAHKAAISKTKFGVSGSPGCSATVYWRVTLISDPYSFKIFLYCASVQIVEPHTGLATVAKLQPDEHSCGPYRHALAYKVYGRMAARIRIVYSLILHG